MDHVDPPADATRYAFLALKQDAHVATADGPVLVRKGDYGRFRREAHGWVADDGRSSMANDRMWLVHDGAQARVLLAKHNGECWCWVPAVDLPNCEPRTGWRIAFESDNWTSYANAATANGEDGYAP